ncbi:MarR family transcriptional regulator, partial [Bacillus thuringiensis]
SYKAMELALQQLQEDDIQTLLRIHKDLLISLQQFR